MGYGTVTSVLTPNFDNSRRKLFNGRAQHSLLLGRLSIHNIISFVIVAVLCILRNIFYTHYHTHYFMPQYETR